MYRVLLIDNEKAVLDALVHALDWDELGFERVDLAEDGLAAWEMALKMHYDIIISDIRMPRMDGLELLKQVSQSAMDSRVIILTAFDEFDYVLRALRLGASNYLMKPIEPGELRASVISALNSPSPTSAFPPVDQSMHEEYFLRRWLIDGVKYRDLDTRASLVGVNIFLRAYNVLLLRGQIRPAAALPGQIREALNGTYEVWMLHDRPNEYVFVVGGKSADAVALSDALSVLLPVLEESGAVLIVGRDTSSYLGVSEVYHECLIAAQSLPAEPKDRILSSVSLSVHLKTPPLPQPVAENVSPLIRRTLQLLRQQYAQPLSLNRIAHQLGTNANYLGYVFHQETGEYFSDYINSIRIQEAQRLLRETNQTVGSIAASVGYSSVNYFCQVFKKATAQSPARYREQK